MLSALARISAKVGKGTQAFGSALFSSTTAMALILARDFNENEESALRNPWVMLAACVAVSANFLVTRRTRLTAMDRQMDNFKRTKISLATCCCTGFDVCQYCKPSRNCAANYVSLLPKMSVRLSSVWTSLNTVFFTINFMNFWKQLFNSDGDDIISQIAMTAFTGYITVSSLASYISLTVDKTDKNADELAKGLRDGDFRFYKDGYKLLTLLIVLLNSVPTLFFAYSITEQSLKKIPGLKNAPDELVALIAALSTLSALLTGIMSTNSQIYKYLTKESKIHVRRWDIVNIANIIESLFFAVANTASIDAKLNKKWGTDLYSWKILAGAGFFGAIAGLTGYVFSNQSYEDTLYAEFKLQQKLESRQVSVFNSSLNGDPFDHAVGPLSSITIDRMGSPELQAQSPQLASRSPDTYKHHGKNWSPTKFKGSKLAEPLLEYKQTLTIPPLTI